MKKQTISILSLIVLMVLSGCSSNKTVELQKTKKTTTLRIAWWGEQPRHDSTKMVIELFEKQNPDIHIEFEYSNWDDYWKRLAPNAAANQLPDILQMDLLYLKAYSDKNLLADLTPYIKNNLIDTNSIDKQVLTGGKIGNQLFGLPLGINAPAIIIDPNLIHSVRKNVDWSNWTWEDFENIALEVHNSKNIYGTNGMKPPEVFFPYYLQTQGASFYNEDGTALGYDNDQLFVDYFQLQLRLLDKGALPQVNVTEQIQRIEDELLVNQQAPMTWAYSNQYYGFTVAANRPLELVTLPGPDQKESMAARASMLFSITESSKHKEEAAKFINFFVNSIEANKILKGERGVPISNKVSEVVKKELSDEEKKVFDYVTHVKNSSKKFQKPDPLGGIEVVKVLQDISEQILFKKITPLEGAQKFRREANQILLKSN